MAEPVKHARIRVCVDEEVVKIPLINSTTAEDVCTQLAKKLCIGPVARHLFALKLLNGAKVWCSSSLKLSDISPSSEYEYRLRFKVPNLSRLRKVDIKAFDYYFHQARTDVMNNKIPDISYEKYKWELVGLGVADMYRVMLEKDVDRDTVEADYKKYIPKEVIKHHLFFIKKPIHDSLGKIKREVRHDAWYVKGEYLKQFEDMAPNYPSEEFKALTDEAGILRTILLKVTPFNEEQPGVSYRYDNKKEWFHLCSIDNLCYISVRNDGTVEISRKNGIPSYLKFSSIPLMFSFVSLLDGYYRLMVKWTFNLCKDVATPSLLKLHALKCHGPVGGEFSYAKLEEKRNNTPGCFILRESETRYNTYYLDICTNASAKLTTYRIDKVTDGEYLFHGDNKTYKSLGQLVSAYRSLQDEQAFIILKECLPPSEYDKSPLLLCELEDSTVEDLAPENVVASLLTDTPRCIDARDLLVYKNQKKEGREGISVVYKSVWKLDRRKKVEVAMKILKQEKRDKYLKSNAIVKLFGMTLSSPFAMVMEYLSLGPLDHYLKEHRNDMKPVDLVEAGAYLATALWHLEEHGVIHGNIRCRKLLVAAHDENTFLVRLADPGLHSYSDEDVHWIPPEFFTNFEFAKASVPADVWAFGTTLWEIFAYGESPPGASTLNVIKKYYINDKKLPIPTGCPLDMYKLMLECWDVDMYRRKKPQAIMRDINQILYQVFNSRRTHSYATAFPKLFTQSVENSINNSNLSLFSGATEETYVGYKSDLISLSEDGETGVPANELSSGFSSLSLAGKGPFNSEMPQSGMDEIMSPDFSTILSNFNFATASTSIEGLTSMQGIFELDANCNVVLQGRIGQGFYGEVYKGSLEQDDVEVPQLVAVKKLKANTLGTIQQDFEREISIMKSLKHPNIVEIKGVIQEPEVSLVMEFVQHGSLQSYLKIHKESLKEKHLLKFALDVARGDNCAKLGFRAALSRQFTT
uniref:Tyrosine-protein kinase n=1 Tax=Timema cristinae TaxID=61476 RepID=A0A7R9GR15_TIMCR|nr:unnamed protein product [Timema cristinae]